MNHDPVFFSIIIPTYNRAEFIGKTIESIRSQQYAGYEIIVIDDGSTDNTEEIIKKYAAPNFTYVKRQNEERSAARNFGTTLAKGQYINWFDSDDIMFSNHLAEANKMIEKYNAPEIFALPFQIQKITGKILSRNYFPIPTINNKLLEGNYLACNPVFVRADIAMIFPFNEDRILSGSEDYELWIRLSARFPIYCGNTITSALIEHGARSMNFTTGNNMLQRRQLILQYLSQDEIASQNFSEKLYKIEGNLCLLVSLYFSLENDKKASIKYLFKSIQKDPSILFTKRMLAVLKHLIVNNKRSNG
ncbi:MAG TPA: glycosyltransferase [Ferruginibacter sp.]|nr:glycosyltransferase [Ferruginibacter sp.]